MLERDTSNRTIPEIIQADTTYFEYPQEHPTHTRVIVAKDTKTLSDINPVVP